MTTLPACSSVQASTSNNQPLQVRCANRCTDSWQKCGLSVRLRRLRLRENNGLLGYHAFAFFKRDHLVRFDVGNRLSPSTRPYDFNGDNFIFRWLSQAKCKGKLALREIAGSGPYHVEEPHTIRHPHCDLCSYAIPVGPNTDSFHSQHVVLIPVIVSEQSSRPIG